MKNIFTRTRGALGERAHARIRYGLLIALFAAGAALLLPSAQPLSSQTEKGTDTARSLQQSFASIAEKYRPVVVSITTRRVIRQAVPQYEFYFGDPFEFFFEDYFGRPRRAVPRRYQERRLEGSGSGVIIDPRGYVLTNYHVISDADDIVVHIPGEKDTTLEATLVGTDPLTDLAVIKIKSKREFAAARLGDSDALKVGDWVIAIGSPFGLEQTVTAGIVSAKRQSLDIEGRRYDDLIQTDAAINRGNSGGPLVNIEGEVIGINTAIYAPTGVFSGIGFAVPVNKAKDIVGDLMKKGKVTRGWLGVEIKDVDEAITRQFGLKSPSGVLVNRVMENSPAAKGGLRRGDVIVRIMHEPVRDAAHFQRLVRGIGPGKKALLTVVRDRKELPLSVTVGDMPSDGPRAEKKDREPPKGGKASWEGITVADPAAADARRYGIDPSEQGVVVTAVDEGDGRAVFGLREGDLIKSINREPVRTTDEFTRVVKGASLSAGVVLDIVRDGVPLYITYTDR